MTREEEIQQKASEEAWYIADTSQTKEEAVIRGYCLGAAYADKTMLDRACEWLGLRVSVDFPVDTNECGMPFCESWIKAQEERIKAMKEFISAFRQAMEGE